MSHKDFCHAGCSDSPTRGELLKNHGRPIDFANAVWNALGEISVDEARIAISRYEAEWRSAPETEVKP